jgi:hypothetical protein
MSQKCSMASSDNSQSSAFCVSSLRSITMSKFSSSPTAVKPTRPPSTYPEGQSEHVAHAPTRAASTLLSTHGTTTAPPPSRDRQEADRRKRAVFGNHRRAAVAVPFPVGFPGYLGKLRIPAKANTDSEGNANGIPGRRRTVVGAQRRWHFDCGTSVRLRQGEPVRSATEEERWLRRKGCGERGAALVPASALRSPGERQLDGC